MMQRQIWYVLRVGSLCVLALALAMAFTPLTFRAAASLQPHVARVGPKAYYLALGDSLAFGYQPNWDWIHGYTNDFFGDLQKQGVQHYDNLACADENSSSMINGGCPYSLLHKYIYTGPQLQAAVNYLHAHAGQVSPVTLDIGANDLIPDLDTTKCTISPRWQQDLTTVDNNLKNVILPQLVAALTVNGQMTGDLLLLNYYDPFQSMCPNTIPYIQTFNQDLAAASGHATLVDIYSAFDHSSTGDHSSAGTVAAPASNLCTYTWVCGKDKNIHPNQSGYALMASTIEHTVNY